MVFCSNCGIELNDDVKICSNCGTPVVLIDGLGTTGNPSEDVRKLRLEAINAINSGNLDDAINLLIQALKLRPDYIDAYDNLGTAFMRKGDYQNALDAYRQAMKIVPDWATPYWGCGLVYAKMNDWNNAILNHTQAISIAEKYPATNNNPHNIAMYYNSRGSAYANISDYLHALPDFEKAFLLCPDRQDYKENIEAIKMSMERTEPLIGKYITEVPKGHPFLSAGNYVTEKSQIINAQKELKTLKKAFNYLNQPSSTNLKVQSLENLIDHAMERQFVGRIMSPILGGITGLAILFGFEKTLEKNTGLSLLSGRVIGVIWLLSAVLYIFGARQRNYIINKKLLHKEKTHFDRFNDFLQEIPILGRMNFLIGYIFLPIYAIINIINNYIIPDKIIQFYESSNYWNIRKKILNIFFWIIVVTIILAVILLVYSIIKDK